MNLNVALLRDKIDRALDTLLLEKPVKKKPQLPLYYGVAAKPKSSIKQIA